jgi:hypothetical protein
MNIGPGHEDLIREAIDKTHLNGCGWANLTVDPTTGANIIAFSSGEGDGGYATYVGYDNNNAIVCFTTDFALLGEES